MKKNVILLLLFFPVFVFSRTVDEIRRAPDFEAFKRKHPELVNRYIQAETECYASPEYQEYKRTADLCQHIRHGRHNLLSGFQAVLKDGVYFKDVILGDLNLKTFDRNCIESAREQKDVWQTRTRECRLYREMFNLSGELLQKAEKDRMAARAKTKLDDLDKLGKELTEAHLEYVYQTRHIWDKK